MKIHGIEGLSNFEIEDEIRRGGRFVLFSYTISVVFMTFKRSSDVFFIREGQSTFFKGLPYTLISLFLGWWGIPWGFIYTPMSLFTNITGGKDVTAALLSDASSQE